MIGMLKRINDALPGLVLGILIYGLVLQLTGIWFVSDKLGYSIGLWYGIVIAEGMAINMAKVIYDSVALNGSISGYGDNKNANRRVIFKSVLRYAVVVILFFILGYFEFGSLYMAFFGVLGLKISAYAQPFMGKVANKLLGRSDASDHSEIVD